MPRPARAPRSPAASPPTTAAVAADGQTGDAGSISTRLSFLIHTISARIALLGNHHFRAHGLNHYSARMLVLLLEREALRPGELVELLVLPQSTISSQLQMLQKKGLVRRRRSRTDNRSVVVTLTPAGQELARDCNGLSLRANTDMLAGVSGAEVQQAFDFLHKVNDTLATLQPQTLFTFHDPSELRALVEREKPAPRKTVAKPAPRPRPSAAIPP